MAVTLPEKLNVLILTPSPDPVERVRAVAPERLNVTYAFYDFIDDVRAHWSERSMTRFTRPGESPRTPAESEALLRDAHVILMSVPFPYELPRRAQNLIWAHFAFAGISNLRGSDWFLAEDFMITSARGHQQSLPIAETTLAAAFMFAKRLDLAVANTLRGLESTAVPNMLLVRGKTMGIIGLGGIGAEVARLAKAVGMRVVANRHSVTSRQTNVGDVDLLLPPSELHELLGQSDFIAVCTMWTDETERMINEAAFAAMKPGAFLLNIARGEIIDEPALAEALSSGRLGGAYLDVWWNDQGAMPHPDLLKAPNVVFTPHVSGRADESHAFGVEVFCDNLRRLLAGEPLENVVDWSRGY
jgi:glyoxylate/hydroxypyruvate reductase